MWPHYQERVTVVDVLDSGACIDGVKEWVSEHGVIAVPTAKFLGIEQIVDSANADGYGYGDGYGDGDGYGNGYGNSYGYGNGYGNGNGNGNGYG